MKYKMGIIGFGWMGCKHFRSIIPRESGIEVTSVYDIDRERLNMAEQMGIYAYDDFEAFINNPDTDIVLVSVPNHLHKQYAIAALHAGKHVICEKPAVLRSSDLLEVMETARERQRLFSVHQNRRWDADFLMVRKALSQNTLGVPVIIESRVQGANGIPSDWRRDKNCGGGMLYDWGVHLIDQLLVLSDSKVISIYTQLLHVNYEVDDNVRIYLKFSNGLLAQIDITTICFQHLPRWNVIGERGTLQILNWECEGKIVKGEVKEVDWSIEAVKNAAGFTRTMRPRPENTVEICGLPVLSADEAENMFYSNFIKALEGDERFYIKPEETLRVCQVMDACFESARTSNVVHCNI